MKKPEIEKGIKTFVVTPFEQHLYDHILNLYGYIDYIEAKNTNMPTQEEFMAFWGKNGYDPQLAIEPYLSYAENGWRDSNNKPIKNWKTKCRQVWFKPQNKIKEKSVNIVTRPPLKRL